MDEKHFHIWLLHLCGSKRLTECTGHYEITLIVNTKIKLVERLETTLPSAIFWNKEGKHSLMDCKRTFQHKMCLIVNYVDYGGVTNSIIWQIGLLCHNNEVLHENIHYIFGHIYKISILSIFITIMQISLMKSM